MFSICFVQIIDYVVVIRKKNRLLFSGDFKHRLESEVWRWKMRSGSCRGQGKGEDLRDVLSKDLFQIPCHHHCGPITCPNTVVFSLVPFITGSLHGHCFSLVAFPSHSFGGLAPEQSSLSLSI